MVQTRTFLLPGDFRLSATNRTPSAKPRIIELEPEANAFRILGSGVKFHINLPANWLAAREIVIQIPMLTMILQKELRKKMLRVGSAMEPEPPALAA